MRTIAKEICKLASDPYGEEAKRLVKLDPAEAERLAKLNLQTMEELKKTVGTDNVIYLGDRKTGP